jgi:L-lysine exporter family protein LysE/ArgO
MAAVLQENGWMSSDNPGVQGQRRPAHQNRFTRFSKACWHARTEPGMLAPMNDFTAFTLLETLAPGSAGNPTMVLLVSSALNGLLLCLTLIVAIGAQNAFVLRQGLRREHVGPLVLACSLADAALIAAGVAGLAGLIGERPWLTPLLAGLGSVFLLTYGLKALQRARRPLAMASVGSAPSLSRRAVMLQLAGFTLLNPHVYLDTVLLVGSVGAQQPGPDARAAFVAGASAGSALWFVALGYGARWLAPLFERPQAWQALDALIGLMMLGMAASLLPLFTPLLLGGLI